jgi:glycosyltransferase involved in cell wall biosynthesis
VNTLPRLTIITPSYNQCDYIEETIQSVLGQGYPDLEYIIVDGGSSDGSVDVIRKYERWLTYWVSEPDRGQPHAINKGLARATGDIIAFINSDDFYLQDAFTKVAEAFIQNPDRLWLCSSCLLRDERTGTTTTQKPQIPEDPAVWLYQPSGEPYCFPQQGVFLRKSLVDQVGQFREDLHYSFDYEYFQRLLFAGYWPIEYEATVAVFRIHADSKTASYAARFAADDLMVADLYFDRVSPSHQRRLRKQKREQMAWRTVDNCWAIAEAHGPHMARRELWLRVLRDPRLLQYRPVWGALRRWQRGRV